MKVQVPASNPSDKKIPMRSRFSLGASALAFAFLALANPSRAEDPFLGQIKEIKCVNCQPGWVTLLVHDPIDMRDFNIYIKNSDYNRVVTPLAGKRIHDKKGECFYWFDKPKSKARSQDSASLSVKPPPVAAKDSFLAAPGSGIDSVEVPSQGIAPPLSTEESEGIASSCLPFVRQIK